MYSRKARTHELRTTAYHGVPHKQESSQHPANPLRERRLCSWSLERQRSFSAGSPTALDDSGVSEKSNEAFVFTSFAGSSEVSQPTGDRTKSGDILEETTLLRRDVVDHMPARPSMPERALIEEETSPDNGLHCSRVSAQLGSPPERLLSRGGTCLASGHQPVYIAKALGTEISE